MEIIERKRKIGAFALERVEKIKNEKFAAEYKSYVKALPSMIINNGLGNALAFEFSKALDRNNENNKPKLTAHGYLLRHIREFAEKFLNFNKPSKNELEVDKRFIEEIMNKDIHTYMFWTEQILQFLDWLRKFAEGMIEKSESGD